MTRSYGHVKRLADARHARQIDHISRVRQADPAVDRCSRGIERESGRVRIDCALFRGVERGNRAPRQIELRGGPGQHHAIGSSTRDRTAIHIECPIAA